MRWRFSQSKLRIDDIEDGSHLRRGVPGSLHFFFYSLRTGSILSEAAHTIYGIPQTINSANYMYFLVLQNLISVPVQRPQVACKVKYSVTDIVISMFVFFFSETRRLIFCSLLSLGEILSLHQGQGLEIFWRDHLSCPSEEDYIDMVLKSRFLCFCFSPTCMLIRIIQRLVASFVFRSGSWSCFHQSSLMSLGKAYQINPSLLCTHFLLGN